MDPQLYNSLKNENLNFFASIKHGVYLNNKWKAYFFSMLALGAIIPISSLIAYVIGDIETHDEKLFVVGVNIFIFILMLFPTYFLIKDYRLKKKTKDVWLCDAVKLDAFAYLNSKRLGALIFNSEVQLRVEFFYMGEAKTYYSKHRVLYKKTANKEIKILYSPKYDEVIILDQ